MTKQTPPGPGIGPAIIVHSLDHARAALAAAAALGRPVTLLSAPGAAEYAGVAWFGKVVTLAAAEWPDAAYHGVIDCADRPGLVLAALRHGLTHVRFTGPKAAAEKLSAIAKEVGAELVIGRLNALDLRAEADPHAACRGWLKARSRNKTPKGARHSS
jgi:hypothetical protein